MMKPAYLALAVLFLCSCGPRVAIAQDPDKPAAAGETKAGDDAEANVKDNTDAPRPGPVQKDAPFKELAGRWTGEGRIGMSEGKVESVKCRATYFVNEVGDGLKQNIRCASAGGKVEVKSDIVAKNGKLSGSWNELVYNLGGDMTGEVTQRGFRIVVRGGELTANMDVIVMNDRQIVEIQFVNSTLRGLTLILKKG
jgi:hypothetical protein